MHLGADGPTDASWSQDLLTDPAQYTSYARTAVTLGEWNPVGDERLVFFRNNVTGVLAWLVFKVFEPGVTTGNLVAVLWNFLAVGFLAWGMGRAFGFVAGFGTAWFLAVNYLFVIYTRQPFLEGAANACLAVAFWGILASSRRWWWVIVAGVVAGAGTFFGKVTALHAAPIFLLGAGLVGWQSSDDPAWRRWGRPGGYLLGMGLVGVVWYGAVYQHVSGEVLAYLKEQSLTLYGTPTGLTSFSGFVQQWFTFGLNNRLLERVPILALTGFAGMCVAVVHCVRGSTWRRFLSGLSPGIFLLVGWFWSAWAAFSPFNYRPVRYQIVLLFPLAAAAGWLLQRWIARDTKPPPPQDQRVSWWAVPILAVVISSGLVHVLSGFFPEVLRGRLGGVNLPFTVMLIGALAGAGWVFRARAVARRSAGRAGWRAGVEIVILLLLLFPLINQGRRFVAWWSRASYTVVSANRDLASLVGPGAVVTGPLAAALTQEAGSPVSLTHHFSLSTPTDFFSRFPITHVVVEAKPDQPFFTKFPEIAASAQHVTTYRIRNLTFNIWRIAHAVGNPKARAYQLTSLERHIRDAIDLPEDSLGSLLSYPVADSADSYTGWMFRADVHVRWDSLNAAISASGRALEHYPDDLVLLVRTGDLTWQKYRTSGGGERQDREDAIALWRRALRLSPGNAQLVERIRTAERS